MSLVGGRRRGRAGGASSGRRPACLTWDQLRERVHDGGAVALAKAGLGDDGYREGPRLGALRGEKGLGAHGSTGLTALPTASAAARAL
jgi:hypothetical protein